MAKVQIYVEGDSAADVMTEIRSLAALTAGPNIGIGTCDTNANVYEDEDLPPAGEATAPARRTRRTKAEMAAAATATEAAGSTPTLTSAPASAAAPTPTAAAPTTPQTTSPSEGALTRQDVLNVVNELAAKKIDPLVIQEHLQANLGVGRIGLLAPEQFGKAIDLLRQL